MGQQWGPGVSIWLEGVNKYVHVLNPPDQAKNVVVSLYDFYVLCIALEIYLVDLRMTLYTPGN